MSEAQGMHSAGTTLWVAQYNQGLPENVIVGLPWNGTELLGMSQGWRSLPELIDCNGIDLKPSVTKVTHLRSDAKAHEKVPGFKDGNQLTCRFNYYAALMTAFYYLIPSAAAAIDAPLSNPGNPFSFWGRKRWFLQLPDGSGWYFIGFLCGMPVQVPEDDRVSLDVTIEVSGAPLFVAIV